MHKIASLVTGALLLAPLTMSAQDADRSVAGGGIKVAGWKGRVDERPAKQGKTVNDSKFEMAGGKYTLKIGPAGIFWNDANTAKGNYEVKASFSEKGMKVQHAHSYGVFIGGNDLADETKQSFIYCIAYGTGKYAIKHFSGWKVTDLVAGAESPAVKKADANGDATNEIGWRVKDGKAACVINGQEVKSYAAAELVGAGKLASLDGVYGYRVSHNVDLTASAIEKK